MVTYTTSKVPSMTGLGAAVPLTLGNAASGFGRVSKQYLNLFRVPH